MKSGYVIYVMKDDKVLFLNECKQKLTKEIFNACVWQDLSEVLEYAAANIGAGSFVMHTNEYAKTKDGANILS